MKRLTGKPLEDSCHRLSYLAEKAQFVLDQVANSPLADKAYTIKGRAKTPARIVNKIKERREGKKRGDDDYDYGPDSITDAYGLRIVTLFQNDIPDVVATIMDMIAHDPSFANFPFVKNSLREIIVYTSRPENDPYSVSSRIHQIVEDRGFKNKIEQSKSRESGYSSVHMIVDVEIQPGPTEKISALPIEIQVRDLFEEAWGEIDHRLRYKPDGRRLGDDDPLIRSWLANLNSLKTFCDGCSQQAWIIKERPIGNNDSPELPLDKKPFETTQEAIATLRPFLPPTFNDQIQAAYSKRARAERSVDVINRENLFLETEQEFNTLRASAEEFLGQIVDGQRTLDAFLRLEIAFCQYNRNQRDSVDTAVDGYTILEEEYPDDPIVLYRLGMAYLYKADLCFENKQIDDALSCTSTAIDKFRNAETLAGKDRSLGPEHWIHYAVPRNHGYALWLSTEIRRPLTKKKRLATLLDAIKATRKSIRAAETHDSTGELIKALNNQIYYLITYFENGGGTVNKHATKGILQKDLKLISKHIDVNKYANIDVIETLCKAHLYVGNHEDAGKLASRGLEVLHERVLKRSGQRSLQLIKITDHLHPREVPCFKEFAVTTFKAMGIDLQDIVKVTN